MYHDYNINRSVCLALPDLEPSTYMVESTTFLQDRHMYYLTCAMEENCLAPSAYEIRKTSRSMHKSILIYGQTCLNQTPIGIKILFCQGRRSVYTGSKCIEIEIKELM